MFYRMKCVIGRARPQLTAGKSVATMVFRLQALAEPGGTGFKKHRLPLRAKPTRSGRRYLVGPHVIARLHTSDHVDRSLMRDFVITEAVAAEGIGVFIRKGGRFFA